MRARATLLISLLLALICSSGCTQLMGGLRRDLDDSEAYAGPTVGGSWSERGLLNEEDNELEPYEGNQYSAVGHSERAPASQGYDPGPGRRSWVTQNDVASNRRDRMRGSEDEEGGAPSYGDTPNYLPQTKRLYKNGHRATRADFIDESQNEGSLWASDGQTNYYFTKNKVRGVGDILTIQIENDLIRDVKTEVTRSLSPRERELELEEAEVRAEFASRAPAGQSGQGRDAVATSAAAPQRGGQAQSANAAQPVQPAVGKKVGPEDIDIGANMQIKAGETMMAEILERYPNGNYKIRGTKKVPYRNGYRLVSLVGVVRGADITEEDTVASGKLYEYRLEAFR